MNKQKENLKKFPEKLLQIFAKHNIIQIVKNLQIFLLGGNE